MDNLLWENKVAVLRLGKVLISQIQRIQDNLKIKKTFKQNITRKTH